MSGNQDGVLILKTAASSMKAAEVFLKNREWRFFSTHSLKEAITFIVQHQPKYILMAADHPNKKVRSIPKLIAQAFPVIVIAYTESASNQSVTNIQSMGAEYNLYPPVSGPAIIRLVAKIEKDVERKAKEERLRHRLQPEQSTEAENQGSSTVLAQAKAALQQMLQADSEESSSLSQTTQIETGVA